MSDTHTMNYFQMYELENHNKISIPYRHLTGHPTNNNNINIKIKKKNNNQEKRKSQSMASIQSFGSSIDEPI